MSAEDRVSSGVGVWFMATGIAVAILTVIGGIASAVIPGMGPSGFSLGFIALIQVGAWQWFYVIPLIISLRRKQRFETAKGLLIVASVLFGVDVLCSGVVIYSLGHTSFR